ncbi:LTA synthase family protein [Halomonas caseinilytica]|uniref:LTA synthase family protein n=1 Tax=Halomonas caseinilytica TaxID=438744 RepID=UPI0007E5A10C|nr:LTA synthase family protein [Halomonas caseinilytica]SEN45260.1 Phosphoglycerol transferase MdoB [Halomonas caseinilytica]
MTQALLLPWCLGLLGTFIAEAALRPPTTAPWRRSLAALAVHLGTWGVFYGGFVLVLQRPWFALVLFLALQLVVVQSSNTKSKTLREPFLCQDFEYFLDAIRHPRLYVPFFGIGLAIGASLAGLATIIGFLVIEPTLSSRHSAGAFLFGTVLIIALSILPLVAGLRYLPACRLDPLDDTRRLGLFSALWAYGLMARRPLEVSASPYAPVPEPVPDTARLPHLVVVQSESFFDPRPWHGGLRDDLLPELDALTEQALARGRLRVPAWGANTVRTETAVLTGLDQDTLGIHRFNPYHQLARRSVPSLAAELRQLGYRTVCLHPYAASFYQRDRVMPRLGFDDFIDIRAFGPDDYCGQYVGDLALADKVGSLLHETDNEPLFVFVITMENHGPLQFDNRAENAARDLLAPGAPPLPDDCGELASYLAHLRNADRMAGRLRQQLEAMPRAGLLCWYGDHVPIMPEVYRHYGEPDGDTPYLLWSSHGRTDRPQASTPLEAVQLSQRIWQAVIHEAQRAHDGWNQDHREQA